ncbi:DUF6262 family protein [Streptomyces sp. NPDC057460]|uniref:DUF6262 family protein n=1 Tax=Streptomyces sp. NPDC057460 TaxID=3346141 RepID=UPI0036BEF169
MKSQAKTQAAEQAIRRLIKRGEAITFQAVQREAGVSHAFLYNHPNMRGRIERLRPQARPLPAPAAPADAENTLVLALTGQITRLKQQRRLEVRALRDALEQAHGENLDLRRELDRHGRTSTTAAGGDESGLPGDISTSHRDGQRAVATLENCAWTSMS